MRFALIYCIFYTVYCCYGSEESKNPLCKKNGYAFYYPLNMNVNQTVKVCLAINKRLLPAIVRIEFANATCQGTTCEPHTVTADFSCWEITAPDQPVKTFTVDIETSDKDVRFKEENLVQVGEDAARFILETDRNTYKMGDTVKIRILAIGFDLKPIKDLKISSLQVRTPYPTWAVVKEWENISSDLGLVHLEFKLAPDTPEGFWQISGDGVYGSFEVKKYILPRFQATITGPDRIYNGTQSVSYTVCGTYSYGKKVKGVALLTAKSTYSYGKEPITYKQVQNLRGGCVKFEIFREDLGLDKNRIWSIELTAAVTEDGTELVESANKYAYINNEPYSFSWNYKNRFVKPKLPYKGEISVKDIEVPLSKSKVTVCYKLRDSNTTNACSNFTLGSDDKLQFIIPPLNDVPEKDRVEIKASIIDHPLTYTPTYYLEVWHSKSKNGIKIIDTKQDSVDCESNLEYVILYNSGRFADDEEVEFKYILTSRGDILNTGSVIEKPKKKSLVLNEFENIVGGDDYNAEGNPVDKFKLKFKLDKEVYTSAKLVVYYDYDGEVISDILDVDINRCAPNPVKAKWAEESLYPGEVGNLNIKADRGSLCSVSSIDKASTFLGSSSRIDIDTVINGFFRYFYNPNQLNCIKPKNKTEGPPTTTPFPNYSFYGYYSSLYDSFDAFKDASIGIMSNLQFISKQCEEIPYFPIRPLALAGVVTTAVNSPGGVVLESAQPASAGFGAVKGDAVDNRGSAVRSFFPETWLWDLVTVKDGETNLERKLPDSITNWEGKVVCMSSDKGFGVSDKIEIQGFKPFFVDIVLPYSIKRNKEILHLPIPVFNYLDHSLPVRVTLEIGNGIVLVDGEDKNSFDMCLGAEDSYTHTYRIKATKLGNLNITVSGFVDPSYAENCAPDSVVKRRDVVQKSLLVEPEGYPSSLVKSALLCANDPSGVDNVQWDINLPENIVPDTVDGKVTINSDILGPMFQNLENILVVPTGCGEQTMATLTPNLYVLQYLQANNALTDKINAKILKNLEIGYQRMLSYAHDDGSFSAFGKTDKDGSMFLTAFVIRTFRQMKKYIFIDDSVIDKAVGWMKAHQLENGCFDPVHHVFHEMGLASSRNQTTALTSYVLISLLETDTKVDENVLAKAKECILSDSTSDKYTLAISSYALGLLNLDQAVKERLDKLLQLAETKDGQLWWKQSEKSQPANVETSSYALISLLQQDPVANLGTASSIVRWLQTQMNPRGAFYSTTDTVVGLDAISRYALLINKNEPNVKISLETKTDKKVIEITKRDRSRTDELPLTEYPNEVKAKITGDGCVSIQAAVNYYLDTAAALDDLKLEIELKPVNQKFKCSFIELKPCVSYTGIGRINMAIVEVNMPSGYAPDQASLYALKTENDSGVKKFEILRNQVVFYLTQLGGDKVCLPFTIEENLVVENVANATVKFYDYYKPEVSLSKSFKLEDCEANINVPA
ncbi:hypothetical protein Trydic_g4074 [Trypoxylus dichotomus]